MSVEISHLQVEDEDDSKCQCNNQNAGGHYQGDDMKYLTSLDLGKKNIPDFMERDSLYETNLRVILTFILSVFFVFAYNRQAYFGVTETSVWYWTCFLLSCFICFSCIVIIIIGIFKCYFMTDNNRNNTNSNNNNNCNQPSDGESIFSPFTKFMNDVLITTGGYYHTSDQFLRLLVFSSEKSAILWSILLLFYASIDMIIVHGLFYQFNNYTKECNDLLFEDDYESSFGSEYTKDHKSACAVTVSSYSTTYSFVVCLVCLASMTKPKKELQDQIVEKLDALFTVSSYNKNKSVKNNIYNNSDHTCTLTCELHSRIHSQLQYWDVQMFHWDKHICLTVFVIILSLLFHASVGTWRLDTFNSANTYHSGIIVLCYFLMLFDSIVVTVFIIFSIRLCIHYEFPGIIMNGLIYDYEHIKSQINNSDHLIEWWLLRRYYRKLIIHHFASNDFANYISIALVGSLITGTYVIIQIDDLLTIFSSGSYRGSAVVFLFWTFYIISITFVFSKNGIRYVRSQIKHLEMTNLIRMAFDEKDLKLKKQGKNNNNDNSDAGSDNNNNNNSRDKPNTNVNTEYEDDSDNDDNIELRTNIIDRIEKDIEHNIDLLQVLTLKVDENFVIALHATIGGFFISIAVELISNL